MCLAQGKKLVRLEDGTYAPIKAEEVGAVLERMAEIFAGVGDDKRVPLSQAGRVQELMRIVCDQNVQSSVKSIFGKLEDIGADREHRQAAHAARQPAPVPEGRLLAGSCSCTTWAPAASSPTTWVSVRRCRPSRSCSGPRPRPGRGLNLVVAPTSVVPNWQREIEKFAPALQDGALAGARPSGARRRARRRRRHDHELRAAASRRGVPADARASATSILDEAQHIKNPLSATARAAKRLKSERRLALTGTPIENRLSEIWSIFDFVSPGLLGSLNQFEEKYARPIDRGDAQTAQRLRATIHPFVLRRTKSEVAKDLPEKIIQRWSSRWPRSRRKLYKQILRQVRESVMSEVEKQGIQKSSDPDPRGAHAPASGGVRPAPARARGRLRGGERQAQRAQGDRQRGGGRWPPRAHLQPVRLDAEADPGGARRREDQLRVPRRLHQGPSGAVDKFNDDESSPCS